MRDPSIHITKTQLHKILSDSGYEWVNIGVDLDYLVRIVLRSGKKHTLTHRALLVSSDRVEKKVKNALKSSNSDASKMASLIYKIRKSKKHRGIMLINQGHRDWVNIKSMAKDAINFCNEFEIEDKVQGFMAYITIGLNKMTRFNITRFPSMYESICLTHQSNLELLEDNSPEQTKIIHDYYIAIIAERTGIRDTYENNVDKYKYFYDVKKVCSDNKFPFRIWIDAQFEGFAWNQILPDPMQLVGDKALKRFNKYVYSKKIKFNEIPKRKMDFSKILKN